MGQYFFICKVNIRYWKYIFFMAHTGYTISTSISRVITWAGLCLASIDGYKQDEKKTNVLSFVLRCENGNGKC